MLGLDIARKVKNRSVEIKVSYKKRSSFSPLCSHLEGYFVLSILILKLSRCFYRVEIPFWFWTLFHAIAFWSARLLTGTSNLLGSRFTEVTIYFMFSAKRIDKKIRWKKNLLITKEATSMLPENTHLY